MFRKRRPPVGSHPGSLNIDEAGLKPRIQLFSYTENDLVETEILEVESLLPFKDKKAITWVDIQGLGDGALLKRIAEIFDLHPLALSDVVHIPSRPKIEDYDSYLFLITSVPTITQPPYISLDQTSMFIGKNFVLTFQEIYGDNLDPIRNRLRQAKGQIRKNNSGYLGYAILDALIDSYYPVLEVLGEYVEKVEHEVIGNPSPESLKEIYRLRRELLQLRRIIWPQRDATNALIREETPLIDDAVRLYLRDCYDHCVQAMDVLESYREVASGLTDVYLSGLSNRLNEVMKTLTIISTIFIPLSFFAGVYGMNFHHMPELQSKWAYPAFWIFSILVASCMLVFFKRRGWLGNGSRKKRRMSRSKEQSRK